MTALSPGSTVGVLGGGQLGRMLALAAARLGFACHVYSDASGPAFDVAKVSTVGPWEDTAALTAFARSVDVVTYEFENVPLAAAAAVSEAMPLRPNAKALAVAQDRLAEKRFLGGLDVPVAPFAAVASAADLGAALETLGTPAILKTRRLGYDGKGQIAIAEASAGKSAYDSLAHAPAILEQTVPFAYEVSLIAVRAASGEMRFYDPPLNKHEGGILRTSAIPSPLPPEHIARAQEIARTIAEALDYVGVLAIEMFYIGNDAPEPLVVNEIAPRVHNSGHWTIDACAVSQFENHIRAVAGWPLGGTERHSDAVMTNLIGADVDGWQALAAEPHTSIHIYGKRDARPGRKMGHVTRLSPRAKC